MQQVNRLSTAPGAADTARSQQLAGDGDSRRIREAASQFEALLIGQMLKSMRECGAAGWLGTGQDQAGASLAEFAEQQVAQVMAAQGGFGLSSLIVQGLTPAAAQPQQLTGAPSGDLRFSTSTGGAPPLQPSGQSSRHASVSGASTRSVTSSGPSD